MKTSEFLEKAKSYITDPSDWCQKFKRKEKPGEANAFCYCSLGALDNVGGNFTSEWFYAIAFLRESMGLQIAYFNDTHTHDEVMAAWDRAIALAKSKGD